MINYTVLELPMGGAKASGLGSRHGAGGIRKYCSQQAIVVTPRLALKREPHMYPYKKPHVAAAGGRVQVPVRPRQARLISGRARPVKRRFSSSGRCAGFASARSASPSSRSSSGIVVSALVWWTVAMPSSSAGVRLKGRSST